MPTASGRRTDKTFVIGILQHRHKILLCHLARIVNGSKIVHRNVAQCIETFPRDLQGSERGHRQHPQQSGDGLNGFSGRRRDDSGGNANQIMFIVAILLSIFAPIAAVLAQLAISRKREYLADAKGALLTRYPEGLADALEKISSDEVRMEVRNQTTAPLFIANPLRKPGQTTKKLF